MSRNVADAKPYLSGNTRQTLAALLATLIALSCGTAIAWTSPTLPILQSGLEEPKLDIDQSSWVGSLLTIGAFVGCFPAGTLADMLGRKTLLLTLTVPMSVSWLLLLLSGEVWAFYLARLIMGLVIGVMSAAAPTYIADISTPANRGRLGALFQLQITFGVLSMYLIGLLDTVFKMTLICSLIPLLFFALFIWMPESPVYLMTKDKTNKAREAIRWLRGGETDFEAELSAMVERQEIEGTGKAGLVDVFKTRVSRKAIMLTLSLMVFQQMSGVNAVVFYAHEIFQESGASLSPTLCSILSACITLGAAFVTVFLIEKAGRRILLLVSSSFMGVGLALLALYLHLRPSGMGFVPIAAISIYFFSFNLGLGPVPWIMMGELFTPRLQAPASALTAASSWGLAFVITKYYSTLVGLTGIASTFALFATWCALGSLFVACCVPETKGKSSEAIQVALGLKNLPTRTVTHPLTPD